MVAMLCMAQKVRLGYDTQGMLTPEQGGMQPCVDAGTTDAYTCTLEPTLTSYITNMVVNVVVATSNTGPCSLTIDGLATISIKKSDGATDPDTDEMYAGRYYQLTYDGTYFRLPAATAGSTANALTAASGSTALGALFAAAAGGGSRAMTQTDLIWDSSTGLLSPKGVSTGDGTVAGNAILYELSANGDNFRKFYVPDALTANLSLLFPNTVPGVSGGYIFASAPASDISTMAFHAPSGNSTTVATAATTRTTGKQLQYDASGNVEATAYNVGSGGLDLTDLTIYEDVDEFTEYMADARAFKWKRQQSGDSNTYSTGGDANHPGVYRMYAFAGSPVVLSIYRGEAAWVVNPSTNYNWTFEYVFSIDAATNISVYIGLSDTYDHSPPHNFLGLRFDTSLSDSNWMYVACASETCTATSSGVAADTSYHRVRFRGTASGTWAFCLDACSSETEIKTNVPTADVFPLVLLTQVTSSGRNLYLDRFYVKRTGLSRY